MDMRGIYTSVTKLRRQVFTEIARLAYEGGDLSRIEELPYKIVPGEVATYRGKHLFGTGHHRGTAAAGHGTAGAPHHPARPSGPGH